MKPIFFILILFSTVSWGASYSGSLELLNRFFLSDGRLRTARLQGLFQQESALTKKLSTLIEVRARGDLGLSSDISQYSFSDAVRRNEGIEAEIRRCYIDYFGKIFQARVGIDTYDWVNTWFPFGNNILFPIDLRNGALDDPSQIREPMASVRLSHKVGSGTMSWLVIPFPKSDRLPHGPNAFGFYETLTASLSPATPVFQEHKIPVSLTDVEVGMQYTFNPGAWEMSPFIFLGHQRRPSTEITISGATAAVNLSYPQVLSAGFINSLAEGDWVFRFGFIGQFNRKPLVVLNPAANTLHRETLFQVPIAFDLAFSQHLKLYSELVTSFREGKVLNATTKNELSQNSDTEHSFSLRLTNETFKNFFMVMESVFTFPSKSILFRPSIQWSLKNYQITLGANLVDSSSREAPLDTLRDTDNVFASFRYYLD